MPCYYPLHGWRARRPEKSGRYRVVFNPSQGMRDLPITVPCGQCIGCRLERSRQWAVRCVHEAQLHDRNCFITLTFDDEHLPSGGSLDVTVCQKFYKRLRKKFGPVRYLHAGEYGAQTGRPHYHACLFGLDFDDKKLWSLNHGNRLYTSESLDCVWGQGRCFIGELTFESAAYVARYVVKKITGEAAAEHYHGLKPEFNTCSRRPGIGAGWIERYQSDVYRHDYLVLRGVKMRAPRSYDKRLDLVDPSLLERVKRRRRVNSVPRSDEQLAVSHIVKSAQIKSLRRGL